MSSTQQVVIFARLAGTRQFLANNQQLIYSQRQLAIATGQVGASMDHVTKRGWLMNQALFTMRRVVYANTLVFLAAGVAAVKMGFDFNNAMQTATVALDPFFDSTEALNHSLNRLWTIAKYTPFQIKDMTLAFRALYPSLSELGISADETIDTIQALIDALSVSGKVTGPALQRATIALQHMAFQGRLTGITVNQLARDGIPMFAILHKTLGLNADQMKRIGDLGIPAATAMQAIIQYMQTTPGYANAAMRQSQMTLTGLWSTFKDNVSRMMGMLEKEAFGGIQQRVNALDNWFNGFFNRFNSGAVSVREVLVYAFGGGAGRIWDQITAVAKLFWQVFSTLVTAVFKSKAVWMTLYLVLLSIHGILLPMNYIVEHFTWLIWLLIPALVAWKVTTTLLIAQTKLNTFWTSMNTTAVKDYTFAQFILSGALRAYYFTLGLLIRRMPFLIALQTTLRFQLIILSRWLEVLRTGYIKNAAGQFALMTQTEKSIRAFRMLAITLYRQVIPAFMRTAIAATITWVAALGPIAWIIAAVIALVAILVVLYFKWKAFHDLVNATIKFMWDHPILLLLIPFVGELLFILKMLSYFKGVWHDIGTAVHWVGDQFAWLGHQIIRPFRFLMIYVNIAVHFVKRIFGGFFSWIGEKLDWLGRKIRHLLGRIPGLGLAGRAVGGFSKYVLGLAEGGVLRQPGWTLVGERGPELLLLPGGSGVLPLPSTINPDLRGRMGQAASESKTPKPVFRSGSQYGQDVSSDRPLVIQLMLGRKVLEEVTVERQGSRLARR